MVTGDAARKLGPLRSLVATVGASFIYILIRLFGRVVSEKDHPWLIGPFGGDYIGDLPYEECAAREGLTVVRNAASGGLVPRFDDLAGEGFDVTRVAPPVRHFYEHTAEYRMDVWADSSFPANIALWLLVTTISRKVNQLNFPLRVLDTAKGMDSEVVLLHDGENRVRYTGWYRRMSESRHVIYTGFYMIARVPRAARPCVKVVFPMPQGNATVVLRPGNHPAGGFELSSDGSGFGDAGFYRIKRLPGDRMQVWRIRTLKEHFRVYLDDRGVLRCDHRVSFLGFRILHLHYRIEPASDAMPAAGAAAAVRPAIR